MRNKELKRIVEAENMLEKAEMMLEKEKEEHERTKKETEHRRAIFMDGMQQFRNQLIREKKEVEESNKRLEKKLKAQLLRRVETEEMLKKEKEEHEITKEKAENEHDLYTESVRYNGYLSIRNNELLDSIQKQAKDLEEAKMRYEAFDMIESKRKELDKAKKEKKEAFSVVESFSKLYLEEVKRRVGMGEEPSEKDSSKKIISLLEDFAKCHPPPYFICPITQDVMQDPCVAADGFTYEAGALKQWLEGGHITSPLTNLRLEHTHLVPN